MLTNKMAGVVGLKKACHFNRCDDFSAPKYPSECPANPQQCRTFGDVK